MKNHLKFRAKSSLLYHYYGLVFGKLIVKVKEISFNVVDGHAAVWAGINGVDNTSWVQGGIEQSSQGGPACAYIETKPYGKLPQLQTFPLREDAVLTVKLTRVSWHHWKCRISWDNEFHESDVVYIKGKRTIDACLEIWGHATALVTINGKTVKGSATT